jgi:hypothetical protein
MSYEFYKILHIVSVIALFLGLAGSLYTSKKGYGMLHGLALLLILITGFGALAKMGLMQGGLPGWTMVKLGVWVILGGAIAVAKRKMLPPSVQITLWLLFGLVAISSAVLKPF